MAGRYTPRHSAVPVRAAGPRRVRQAAVAFASFLVLFLVTNRAPIRAG